jgi:hypothetical protein
MDSVVLSLPGDGDDDGASSVAGRPRAPASFLSGVSGRGPAVAPRSVMLEVPASSMEAQMQALEADLQATAAAAAQTRAAEDVSLRTLQERSWDVAHTQALEAMAAKMGVPRVLMGLGEASEASGASGPRKAGQLQATMRHVVSLCARKTGGVTTPVRVSVPQPLRGGGVQASRHALLASLGATLNQDVDLRRQRVWSNFRAIEGGLADLHAATTAAAQRAWQHVQRIQAARAAATRKIQEVLATTAAGGAPAAAARAELETQSQVSALRDVTAQRANTVCAITAQQLRQQADRLHMVAQMLLRKQLQMGRDKVRVLASLGAGASATSAQERVEKLQSACDALGQQVARIEQERMVVEEAWQAAVRPPSVHGGGGPVSAAAVRAARRLHEAAATATARRAAAADTFRKALLEKLDAETRDAVRAVASEFQTTLRGARSALQTRTRARVAEHMQDFLVRRGVTKKLVEELAQNVAVVGYGPTAARMLAAADTAAAQHLTNRVHTHLTFLDGLLTDTPAFVRSLV